MGMWQHRKVGAHAYSRPPLPLSSCRGEGDCNVHHHYANRNQQEGSGVAAKEPLDNVISGTVQTCLLLLIDLVYRLVLFGSVPAVVDQHGLLSATIVMGDDGDEDVGGGYGGEDGQDNEGGNSGGLDLLEMRTWPTVSTRQCQRILQIPPQIRQHHWRHGSSVIFGHGRHCGGVGKRGVTSSSLLLC
jgi:hypothetical protein